MALKPTLYKVDLQLVDTDRNVYQNCKFTLAQHPSETLTRMMVRLMVFALNYDDDLTFTKGLSSQDEPDLWNVADTSEITQWIEVGQASTDRMRKGVSRAQHVLLYAYGSETDIWWEKQQTAFASLPKINVYRFFSEQVAALQTLVERKMALTISISEGELYINSDDKAINLTLEQLL